MRTDAHDLACVRDATVELLLSHTATLPAAPPQIRRAHRLDVDRIPPSPTARGRWGSLSGGDPAGSPHLRGCSHPAIAGRPDVVREQRSPAHPPSSRSLGGSLTDLLADQARSGASEPATATRMVLDTSVLISDPDSHHGVPGRRRGDPAGRRGGARSAQGPDGRRRAGRPSGDPVDRGAARRQRRRHPPSRCRCPTAARCASRRTASTSTRSASTASTRPRTTTASSPPRLGQAVHGRTVVVSNDAALRIKAAQLGLEAMEHQRLRGRTAFERPVGWTTIEVLGRDRRPALRQPGGHRHRRARPARRRPRPRASSSDRYAVLRSGSQSALVRHRRRRARADAARARAVGPAAALEGAAVRPRPPARPRGAGRRPRRHGRHRQDDPRPGRRARAGDGVEPLRQGRRVPPGRAGRARPSSGSCRAPSTRSSTRG